MDRRRGGRRLWIGQSRGRAPGAGFEVESLLKRGVRLQLIPDLPQKLFRRRRRPRPRRLLARTIDDAEQSLPRSVSATMTRSDWRWRRRCGRPRDQLERVEDVDRIEASPRKTMKQCPRRAPSRFFSPFDHRGVGAGSPTRHLPDARRRRGELDFRNGADQGSWMSSTDLMKCVCPRMKFVASACRSERSELHGHFLASAMGVTPTARQFPILAARASCVSARSRPGFAAARQGVDVAQA